MTFRLVKPVLHGIISAAAAAVLLYSEFAPQSWGCAAYAVWFLFASLKGWRNLGSMDQTLLAWGWGSVAAFNFYLQYDPSFKVCVQTLQLYKRRDFELDRRTLANVIM